MEHGLPPRHQVFGAGTGSQLARRDRSAAETAPGSRLWPRGQKKWAAGASHLPPQAQGLQRATFQSWVARTWLHLLLITPGDSPGEEGLAANWDQLTATKWPQSRASQARRAPLPVCLHPFRTNLFPQTQRWGSARSAAEQRIFLPPAQADALLPNNLPLKAPLRTRTPWRMFWYGSPTSCGTTGFRMMSMGEDSFGLNTNKSGQEQIMQENHAENQR